MSRKYIIFYWHVFSERDWVRYSCDAIGKRGYEVRIVQLCEALEGIASSQFERRDFVGIEGVCMPKTHSDILSILDELSHQDLILIASPINPDYLWLHLQLGKRGLRFVQLSLGRLPEAMPWQILIRRDWIAGVLAFFNLFRHLAYRIKFHLKLMLALGWNYFRIPAPTLWGRAGAAKYLFATEGVHLWRSEPVELESFDIAWAQRAETELAPIQTESYAVFIDEALCDHPDYRVNKTPLPAQRETYFSGLRRLFDRLENELGLETIIALHPKANYKPNELTELFGPRKILSGQTPNLVRGASLVMLHNSTSICYAVVYRKPIFLITNDDIDASWLRADLDLRSEWLDQPIINLDNARGIRASDISIRPIDDRLYAHYENQFLRARQAISGPPAIVLAKRFEQLSLGDRSSNSLSQQQET